MADPGTTLQHHRSIFGDWRSISISLYMALVGYGVLVGIPVISTAWVELLGYTEVQVGRAVGADLGYSAVFVMCGTKALGGLSIYALAYARLRKTIPALADAS